MTKRVEALLKLYFVMVGLMSLFALATTEQSVQGLLIGRVVLVSATFCGLFILFWLSLSQLGQSRPILVGALRGMVWGAGLAFLNYCAAGDPAPADLVVAYKTMGMALAFAFLASEGGPKSKVPTRLRKLLDAESQV